MYQRQDRGQTSGFWSAGGQQLSRDSILQAIKWVRAQRLIDSITAQVLDVEPYADEVKSLFDYASISTDPARYGFSELRFAPDFD